MKMRRLILLLLLLVPAWAGADFIRYFPPASSGSGTWDGGTVTNPGKAPTGCTNPGWSFTADDTAGLCITGVDSVIVQTGAATGRLQIIGGSAGFLGVSAVAIGGSDRDPFSLAPPVAGAGSFTGVLTSADLTGADKTWTFPNATGDVAVIASAGFAVRTGAQTWAARSITSPTGLNIIGNADGVAGNITIDPDTSVIPLYSSGTASVSGTGAVGTFYFETDRPAVYTYPATNAETVLLSLPAGTGTSGGIPYFTATADVIGTSAALTANLPVIGGGAGTAPTVGTRSGDTTTYVTTTGTQTSGDCVKIDANGNHIANGSACGGGGFDPGTTATIYCEFIGGAGSSGSWGECGMNHWAISGGSASLGGATNANPGMIRLQSLSANDNSGAAIGFANGTGLAVANSTWANKDWSMDYVFIPGTNGAITNAAWYIGLSTNVNTDPSANATAGIWIRWDADRSDTTYVFVMCDASGGSGCGSTGDAANAKTVASTITPVAGTANRFRIRRATTGVGGNVTYYFRVNDETEKTFCSSGCDNTVPATSASYGLSVIYMERATGTNLAGDLDYVYLNIPGLVRY